MLVHGLALLVCAIHAVHADNDGELPSRFPVPRGLDFELLEIAQAKVEKGMPRNDGAAVKELLDKGADASSVGEYNYTALMWAIVRHKPDVVQHLLDAGADTEYINAWGRNAMFLAAWEGQPEVMEALIRAGANISAAAQHDEWSPIHKVAEMGHVVLARQLIEAGANLNARTLPDKKHADASSNTGLAG